MSHEEQRISAGEVLEGLELHPLERNQSAEFVFALIKYQDEEADSGWSYRTSGTPNREELLGALQVQVDLLRKELLDEWE